MFTGSVCLIAALLTAHAGTAPFAVPDLESICALSSGETRMVNGLWVENPDSMKFGEGRTKVVIADLKGPGIITMIHFALPAAMKMDRSVTLRMWWDGEEQPSVECPLTDFFCDPNGALERVNTALVNKKRGWNAYFPMPFAKSARIEVSSENRRYPSSWDACPCYSYVMYRELEELPENLGRFHATWRQETLLLGKAEFEVFTAQGTGQFAGWNMTIRGVGPSGPGYPVDENEKLFVDGESEARIEWQGLEDSFGFSWGFPEVANEFPYTGYQPYLNGGAAAYRFCVNDRVTFKKSLRMTVGFGKNEAQMFFDQFSKPENPLQLSSVAYWYQAEPHAPLKPLPPMEARMPAGGEPQPANAEKYAATGETVVLNCGKPGGDIEFLKDGWDFVLKHGFLYSGFPTEVNHCWADKQDLDFEIVCPKGVAGILKLFLIDGDNFCGGRIESVAVAGREMGRYEDFQKGRWLEVPISATDTAQGAIPVVIKNLKPEANAVVSLIRFIAKTP